MICMLSVVAIIILAIMNFSNCIKDVCFWQLMHACTHKYPARAISRLQFPYNSNQCARNRSHCSAEVALLARMIVGDSSI